jgi:hypothetical protein
MTKVMKKRTLFYIGMMVTSVLGFFSPQGGAESSGDNSLLVSSVHADTAAYSAPGGGDGSGGGAGCSDGCY